MMAVVLYYYNNSSVGFTPFSLHSLLSSVFSLSRSDLRRHRGLRLLLPLLISINIRKKRFGSTPFSPVSPSLIWAARGAGNVADFRRLRLFLPLPHFSSSHSPCSLPLLLLLPWRRQGTIAARRRGLEGMREMKRETKGEKEENLAGYLLIREGERGERVAGAKDDTLFP